MLPLLADVGIPMLFWHFPAAIVAFLPIVIVETLIAWPVLRMPVGLVFVRVLAANALSTFVGVPIAWVGLVVINIVTTGGSVHGFDTPLAAFQSVVLQASWLIPYEHYVLAWLIPAATLVLLVPYFIASVYVERWLLLRQMPEADPRRIIRASWLANLVSYAGLAVYTALWFVHSLPAHETAG